MPPCRVKAKVFLLDERLFQRIHIDLDHEYFGLRLIGKKIGFLTAKEFEKRAIQNTLFKTSFLSVLFPFQS